jgi:hypothetical protein
MIGRDPKWMAAQIEHVNPKVHLLGLPAGRDPPVHRRQAVWTLMRFADEPAERVPSRQVTRLQRQDQRGSVPLERDTFDLEVESLTGDGDEP